MYEMQGAIGVERQLPHNTTVAVTYTYTRALHDGADGAHQHAAARHLHPRPAHSGVYPFGSPRAICSNTNPAASCKQNILMANFNTRFTRNVSLFGNYQWNHSHDLPGTPTNPYNFAADWGRSSLERTSPVPTGRQSWSRRWTSALSPFITLQSGSPVRRGAGPRYLWQHAAQRAAHVRRRRLRRRAEHHSGDFCVDPTARRDR